MLKYFVLVVIALAVLGLARIRLAGDDVAVWHVDPQAVTPTGTPNQFLMRDGTGDADSPVFAFEAVELARVFDEYVLSKPRVTRLVGEPEKLWMTYIQRSKWFGFPDYISVRVFPVTSEKAGLIIYSRSRYGGSDWGVNKARVDKWVAGLRLIEAANPVAAE